MLQLLSDLNRASLVVLIVFLAVACGKQGPPSPPVRVIPRAATDLVIAQRGPKIILSWEYPALATSGEPLSNVDRISVYRFEERLPLELAGSIERGEVDQSSSEPKVRELFDRVPVVPPAQFERLATTIGVIESADIPSVTAGTRVIATDRPPIQTDEGGAVRYTYAVTTTRGEIESDLSNLVTIAPLDVAAAPISLVAVPGPNGATLRWIDPSSTITGEDLPEPGKYLVYRFPESGGVLITPPVSEIPVTELSFTDDAPYGTWRYGVTRLSSTDPIQESELSLLARTDVTDLTPPPVVASVETLVEARQIRLLWEAVDSTDVVGYNVYRSAAGSEPVLMVRLDSPDTTSWTDTVAQPGVEYVYLITTFDSAGNESERVQTDSALIRK